METPKFYYMNTYHHLYNRGVNREKIFFEDKDYMYFLRKMKEYKEKYSIKIICYCLLHNHFHFFVKQTIITPDIGKFIGDLTNAYTRGTNIKYNRTGVLFQGKTKSKMILEENYFLWLCKYILNNPVKAGLVSKAEEWHYSSAKCYFQAKEEGITETEEVMKRFNCVGELISFINDKKLEFDYSKLF